MSKRDDQYSFRGVVADVLGIPKAMLIKEIDYWVTHNKGKGAGEHDGEFWMYNTAENFSKHFYFLSQKSIERWLRDMERDEVIFRDRFNKYRGNQTYWYRVNYKFYDGVLDGSILNLRDWTDPQNEESTNPQNEESTNPQNEESTNPQNEESYNTSKQPSTKLVPNSTTGDEDDVLAVDLVLPFDVEAFGRTVNDANEYQKKSSAKRKGKTRADYVPDAVTVIKHLNQWAGRKFPCEPGQRGADVNQDYVIGLLKKKYTVEELTNMIDFKIYEWKGGNSEKYLQPSTLLSGNKKCIGYIQASIEAQDNPEYVAALKRARDKEDGKGSGGTVIGEKTRAAAERLANW